MGLEQYTDKQLRDEVGRADIIKNADKVHEGLQVRL